MSLKINNNIKLLIFIIFIFSCKEDPCESGCSTLNGYFTTSDINGIKPVTNMFVELEWSVRSKFFPQSEIAGSTTTNSEGYFNLTIVPKSGAVYYVHFIPPTGNYLYLYRSPFEVTRLNKVGAKITINKHLPQRGGQVKLIIENPEAIPSESKLICNVIYSRDNEKIYLGSLDSVESNVELVDVVLYEHLSLETIRITSDSTFTYNSIYFSNDNVQEFLISW